MVPQRRGKPKPVRSSSRLNDLGQWAVTDQSLGASPPADTRASAAAETDVPDVPAGSVDGFGVFGLMSASEITSDPPDSADAVLLMAALVAPDSDVAACGEAGFGACGTAA